MVHYLTNCTCFKDVSGILEVGKEKRTPVLQFRQEPLRKLKYTNIPGFPHFFHGLLLPLPLFRLHNIKHCCVICPQ